MTPTTPERLVEGDVDAAGHRDLPAALALGRGGVVLEHVAHVARLPAGVADHVAGVGHLECGQLLAVGVHRGGEAPQQAGPVARGHRPPGARRRRRPGRWRRRSPPRVSPSTLVMHLAGGGVADVHARDLCRWQGRTAPQPGAAGRARGGPPVQCGAVPETRAAHAPTVQFNLAKAFDTLVETLADRECIVWRDRRLTYARRGRALAPAGLLPARPGPGRAPRARRARRAGSRARTTSPWPSTTATSTSRACWARTGPASPPSTSTTATSARSCATCSTTPGRAP